MSDAEAAPILYLDFDDTITCGDVLDRIIERFSRSDDWREAEAAWQAGSISTRECLTRQIAGLRVSADALVRFSASTRLDPSFREVIAWSRQNGVELIVLSDNFKPVIGAILAAHHVDGLVVRANDMLFEGDRVSAHFGWTDPECARCAHCKAQHLRRAVNRPRIFVGDGLSDVCAAEVADIVFAKNALAAALDRRAIRYRPFASLADVARALPVVAQAGSMR